MVYILLGVTEEVGEEIDEVEMGAVVDERSAPKKRQHYILILPNNTRNDMQQMDGKRKRE